MPEDATPLMHPRLRYNALHVILLLALTSLVLLVVWHNRPLPIWNLVPDHPSDVSLPIVNLGYATYGGLLLEDQHVFLGMRYARPPVGDRRWRAPVYPPSTVEGVRDATKFGYSCYDVNQIGLTPGYSEDCLFVNVWTPATRRPGELLPVLFWMYGGGYLSGTSNWYPGQDLVRASGNNILFVSINYRVAQFGFLASEDLARDGDVNFGLLDQHTALIWVKEHISKFGGDPDQVTIWGESAGAGSVAMQLLAYGGTSQLFRAAMGNSVFFPFQPKLSDPYVEHQFRSFATLAGCGNYINNTVGCLRSRDVNILLLAGHTVALRNPSIFAFMPVIDGNFLQEYPVDAFLNGNFRKVPAIMGYNTNEGTGFATAFLNPLNTLTLDEYLTNQFPNITAQTLQEIYSLYPPSKHSESLAYNDSTPFGRAAAIYGEAVFICEARLISGMQAQAGESSYVYRFNRTAMDRPEGFGTVHGADIPLFFNAPPGPPGDAYSDLVRSIQAYIISFVRTTNPNTFKLKNDVVWPMAGSTSPRQLRLEEKNTRPEQMPSDLFERCNFWWTKGSEMQY